MSVVDFICMTMYFSTLGLGIKLILGKLDAIEERLDEIKKGDK